MLPSWRNEASKTQEKAPMKSFTFHGMFGFGFALCSTFLSQRGISLSLLTIAATELPVVVFFRLVNAGKRVRIVGEVFFMASILNYLLFFHIVILYGDNWIIGPIIVFI